MLKLPSSTPAVKPIFSNQHRRWYKIPRWVSGRLSGPVFKTYFDLVSLLGTRRRICHRHLASVRGVSTETIRLHVRAMERAGVLRTVHTRIGPRRNAPNRYILLDLDGTDLAFPYPQTKLQGKPSRSLNTKAPPRARRGVDNHPPIIRKLYGLVGRYKAENKGLRAVLRVDRKTWIPHQPRAITGTLDSDVIEQLRGKLNVI